MTAGLTGPAGAPGTPGLIEGTGTTVWLVMLALLTQLHRLNRLEERKYLDLTMHLEPFAPGAAVAVKPAEIFGSYWIDGLTCGVVSFGPTEFTGHTGALGVNGAPGTDGSPGLNGLSEANSVQGPAVPASASGLNRYIWRQWRVCSAWRSSSWQTTENYGSYEIPGQNDAVGSF